ncbi:tyrosine-protein kinase hopscotch-like [Cylas formicarius]|uniref:tyrosine-protein kinase hopscotch-like n=1 Tax=Cylas formicarius TaxID=197179 RepID=UPI002958CB94|nr:tyrosine-protein kinase hopscotch-like [Cylas formicarius]
MAEFALTVNLVLEDEEKTMSVPCLNITTAEDVCMHVCKYLNITTIARHLFALRITGEQLFLMPSAIIKEENVTTVDLRIRFKVASITKLKKIDVNAYNYYFQQARKDVLDNKIPDLVYDRFKEELVGLGITDMFRVMLEKKISRETVENDYKKYIPKEILKKHIFFIKKLIHTNLGRLSKSVTDASYVMAEYVKQLDLIAPEYLSEVYKAQIDQDGSLRNILVKVSPSSNITYCSESKRDEWKLICTIEELGFISIRNNGAIEISRKNGIPFYLKFRKDDRDTRAFISLLDGYYRLTCKWTFNICKEVITPSLKKLQQMKCHGPVGGEFSYAKLEDKRANRTGCFIIRESETNYNTYYIDVCVKDSIKPKTYKVEKIKDEFIFNGDITRYKTIQQLIKAYSDPEGAIFLQECLPPSEYDLSQVLLCRSDSLVGDSIADTSQISELPSTPVCINFKDLQVYKEILTSDPPGLGVIQ